jgi:hypothetical protein
MYNWLIYCYFYYYIYTYITKIMSSKIKLTNNIVKMRKPNLRLKIPTAKTTRKVRAT